MENVLDTVDTNSSNDKTPCVIPNQGASVPREVVAEITRVTPEQKQLDTKLTEQCNGK